MDRHKIGNYHCNDLIPRKSACWQSAASAHLASEIPAEPGVQEFMRDLLRQSLAPRSRPPYLRIISTLDDLKGFE